MSKANRAHNEQSLRDQLRREADATRPAFSEMLHERIWHVVQESEKPKAVPERHSEFSSRHRRWGLVTVISASLLAAVFVWQAAKDQATLDSSLTGSIKAETPPLSVDAELHADLEQIATLTGGVTETVDAWLDTTLTEQRWAYLDQDATVFLETITKSLPFGLASIDSSELSNGNWPSEHAME